MRKWVTRTVAVAVVFTLYGCGLPNQGPTYRASPAAEKLAALRASPASLSTMALPFLFEKNEGQKDRRVKFLVRRSGHNLFLTQNSLVFVLANRPNRSQSRNELFSETDISVGSSSAVALHLNFVDANTLLIRFTPTPTRARMGANRI